MSNSFADELRKIPFVTRVVCASSLSVTLSCIMQLVPPYKVLFIREYVIQRWEIWRPFTSLFLGTMKFEYIFELFMLYRNSNSLETQHYARRSADYAWQLFLATIGILIVNIPLQSVVHSRPLLHTLTYLVSSLSPPGSQASIMGLITIPVTYFPYAMLGMDLLMGGTGAAAQGVSGMIVGHLWWWFVWGSGTGAGGAEQGRLAGYGQAPGWLRNWFGETSITPSTGMHRDGVTSYAPRRRAEESAGAPRTGYNWGSGHRLGDS
ncbi:hypothetical protein SERLA73DRAFT_174913 [Serpula lacrymans var. lacrymans S7.3]|uniref:Derlin n=2 Tax=Serpula lacrymans var. lacrymans TaxID=341189 RepID=F8PJ73_SERL3|nr:uncharacterized protein SERLADRAFT_345806 [Serpula lacrymans var. lacrymans S7.9]EGO03437.1 hypothetical protein SERLA73DRAFT_174913 [Serpula lacrymans var. lacrymans S7.3]EGO30097.1 hypothetical protein SERLADRAFT_345806 [Serpula lacrymans var. lacrymans S7.9]